MINLYPGPSKLDERIPKWLEEGLDSGMLSVNHRSQQFMQQYFEISDLFKEVFNLPEDFEVYFLSSATECWEVISQSFSDKKYLHIYNGSFGEKWSRMNASLGNSVREIPYSINELPEISHKFSEDIFCLTHNETSNGTKLPSDFLLELRKRNKKTLIAVDATSSMAGVELPWESADIWFASVQKCFGLPSGMALMFCHKRVLSFINSSPHYNHIGNLNANYIKWQTTHTPNVSTIYFLWRLLQDHKGLELRSEKIKKRAKYLYDYFEKSKSFEVLVKNRKVRSDTVLAIKCPETDLIDLMGFMDNNDIILGKGYGPWKNETFRIANFPAIKRIELDVAKSTLLAWEMQIKKTG